MPQLRVRSAGLVVKVLALAVLVLTGTGRSAQAQRRGGGGGGARPPQMHFTPPQMHFTPPQMHYTPPRMPQFHMQAPKMPHVTAHPPKVNAGQVHPAKPPHSQPARPHQANAAIQTRPQSGHNGPPRGVAAHVASAKPVHHGQAHPGPLKAKGLAETSATSSNTFGTRAARTTPAGKPVPYQRGRYGAAGGFVSAYVAPRHRYGYGWNRHGYRYSGWGGRYRRYYVNRNNGVDRHLLRLIADLDSMPPRAVISQVQKNEFRADLLAVARGGWKPASASVQQLANDLADTMTRRKVLLLNTAELAADLKVVMNSRNVTPAQLNGAIQESQSLLRGSAASILDVQTVVSDLRAVSGLAGGLAMPGAARP